MERFPREFVAEDLVTFLWLTLIWKFESWAVADNLTIKHQSPVNLYKLASDMVGSRPVVCQVHLFRETQFKTEFKKMKNKNQGTFKSSSVPAVVFLHDVMFFYFWDDKHFLSNNFDVTNRK